MQTIFRFLLLSFFIATISTTDYSICSFNVQVFGVTKMQKPDVVATLVKIFSRYDFCLIQEIRDASQTAIYDLLNRINTPNAKYDLVLSDRLGRTSSKEQYGFIYAKDRFSIIQSFQFDDSSTNWFERPPFSVLVKPANASSTDYNRTLFITANHIQPSNAPFEIDKMFDVYHSYVNNQTIKQEWREVMKNRWLFMGDMNAGCSYVSNSAWNQIRLRNQTTVYRGAVVPKFSWLIPDTAKTTTAQLSGCPYDRFVVTPDMNPEYGANPLQVVKGSPGIFNFTLAYDLPSNVTSAVSDHYPIELKLRVTWNEPQNNNSIPSVNMAVLKFVSHWAVMSVLLIITFAI